MIFIVFYSFTILTTLRTIAPVAAVPSLSAVPAMSKWIHFVPSSTKASKKLAATLAPAPALPTEFLKSALCDLSFAKY